LAVFEIFKIQKPAPYFLAGIVVGFSFDWFSHIKRRKSFFAPEGLEGNTYSLLEPN
jgi:hypothetical protein